MSKNFVVIHPGALGDVLLAVPAIRCLRARYSEHRCLLISHESVGRFLLQSGLVDDWISIESKACIPLFSGELPTSDEIRSRLQNCEIAFAWMKDEEGTIAMTLTRLGIHQVRIQSPFHTFITAKHQSHRFMEASGEIGCDRSVEAPVVISQAMRQQGAAWLVRHGIAIDRPIVVIHPGSGSPLKCTKPEILASVIDRLRLDEIQILLLEGPADQATVNAVLDFTLRPSVVIRNVELTTVAGILTQAHWYIGHDSGMTHLSGLLGVPTLAIFGPTDPERWAPRGPHVTVLRGGPCSCPSWEQVALCSEKTCLAISPDTILAVCRKTGEIMDTAAHHRSSPTLSPSHSYAKVAR